MFKKKTICQWCLLHYIVIYYQSIAELLNFVINVQLLSKESR